VVRKGHPESRSTHDAYLEISGPSATDVHHNFVQRWNAATERTRTDGHWPVDGVDDLAFPASVSAPRGTSVVQYLAAENVIAALAAAGDRGVRVIAVVPVEPDGGSTAETRATRSVLARRPNFLLAGLVRRSEDGGLRNVYVHDKLMIVDDEWVTIGSANVHQPSLHGNAEMNASVWDPVFARALRVELFAEPAVVPSGDEVDGRAPTLEIDG
jgi:phosphatidylserine/phosphatidylglycerophosphate/cardiolipin synthase-like enzyme